MIAEGQRHDFQEDAALARFLRHAFDLVGGRRDETVAVELGVNFVDVDRVELVF